MVTSSDVSSPALWHVHARSLRVVGVASPARPTKPLPPNPVTVRPADVFEFLAHQRGDRTLIRMTDREMWRSRPQVPE
jgi:hypothetical protein